MQFLLEKFYPVSSSSCIGQMDLSTMDEVVMSSKLHMRSEMDVVIGSITWLRENGQKL